MGKVTKKKPTTNNKSENKKLSFATLGTLFPTKKEGRKAFKPKLDKYGVASIQVTLNNGEIYELDSEMFIFTTEKTISTRSGEMDIQELVLGY